jgi:NADPH:quinone reductase-like Zn-dependent oxidoreductase
MTATMKALVLEKTGELLRTRELPRPSPGPGRVLVRVAAGSVNPLDVKIRDGKAAHAQVETPAILGIDLAGVVTEVGPGVTRFAPGDEVYGMAGGVGGVPGSLAEYAAADADLLARKPASLSMVQAAALPLSVITAWEGLVDRAGVHAGQRVLIHGGAGGVGHVAVQLAVARGATVFATGRGRSLEVIAGLGGRPIDYTTTTAAQQVELATGGEGFDIIFDTMGGAVLDSAFASVRRYTGHVVSILGWGAHSLAPLSFRGATYSGVFTLLPLITGEGRARHGEILAEVAELADAGALAPIVHPRVYDWDTSTEAYEVVGSGAALGKVILDLASKA